VLRPTAGAVGKDKEKGKPPTKINRGASHTELKKGWLLTDQKK